MHTIYFDRKITDDSRREQLYDGQLFVYSPSVYTQALCKLGREMAEAAFAPLDPRDAQYEMSVEAYAAILAELKPKFIHHPQAKENIQGILRELGCDLDKTYFDVPRMRTSTAGGYLTTGIAYAFHPHRDTWYSAPMCQLNWWLPIYDIEAENAMAFHPQYWGRSIRNGSESYNYQEWVKTSRFIAAQQVKHDTRKQPHAEEPIELDPQVRVITPPGGLLIFSAAHLHSSVPNTSSQTRFSIDFRTVHLDDVLANRGAPNLDSHCTGTTLGDYRRGTDFATIPEEFIERYKEVA
ncbi:MAG: phytanoyl-CoA dioxygenase family protein [Chloroflexi bacterium]|nr:phytanoyl-CoA dioxygenase family protein [Chloroflexota bacterium]